MVQKKPTQKQIEKMAIEVRSFLLEHEIWQDVTIYFNGKAFATSDGKKFAYNDPDNLIILEGKNPRDYFEYVNPDLLAQGMSPVDISLSALKAGKRVSVGGMAIAATVKGTFDTIDGEFDPNRNELAVTGYVYGELQGALGECAAENVVKGGRRTWTRFSPMWRSR